MPVTASDSHNNHQGGNQVVVVLYRARLYISEGTYYRNRRKALWGITRALLEINAASRGI